ncbi:collagen alpha-1(I) chain-like [Pantherophis guttatus]|uniref:Collagen alpha-1(I) chain-like n=1 Tax=Pantherophis guttatus TaxID=94885 RepID=A0ABM3YNC2_PANGU|nr:collagen alpha-1(I) chain-like [Pantherophis guttatus]
MAGRAAAPGKTGAPSPAAAPPSPPAGCPRALPPTDGAPCEGGARQSPAGARLQKEALGKRRPPRPSSPRPSPRQEGFAGDCYGCGGAEPRRGQSSSRRRPQTPRKRPAPPEGPPPTLDPRRPEGADRAGGAALKGAAGGAEVRAADGQRGGDADPSPTAIPARGPSPPSAGAPREPSSRLGGGCGARRVDARGGKRRRGCCGKKTPAHPASAAGAERTAGSGPSAAPGLGVSLGGRSPGWAEGGSNPRALQPPPAPSPPERPPSPPPRLAKRISA